MFSNLLPPPSLPSHYYCHLFTSPLFIFYLHCGKTRWFSSWFCPPSAVPCIMTGATSSHDLASCRMQWPILLLYKMQSLAFNVHPLSAFQLHPFLSPAFSCLAKSAACCPRQPSCSELHPEFSCQDQVTHSPSFWECWGMMAFIWVPLWGLLLDGEDHLTQDSHSLPRHSLHPMVQRGSIRIYPLASRQLWKAIPATEQFMKSAKAFFVTILQPNTLLCLILLPSLPHRGWSQWLHNTFSECRTLSQSPLPGETDIKPTLWVLGPFPYLGTLDHAVSSTQNTLPLIFCWFKLYPYFMASPKHHLFHKFVPDSSTQKSLLSLQTPHQQYSLHASVMVLWGLAGCKGRAWTLESSRLVLFPLLVRRPWTPQFFSSIK